MKGFDFFTPKDRFINNLKGREKDVVGEGPQLTERDTQEYEQYLGFDTRGLRAKTILNIGCGHNGLFEKELLRHGTTVYALSPYFAAPGRGGREMLARYKKGLPRGVGKKREELYPIAAFAEEKIPLLDHSVDAVFALYSVPLYVGESDSPEIRNQKYEKLFSEIVRILKQNGTASLYPIPESKKEYISSLLNTMHIQRYEFVAIPEFPGGNAVYYHKNPNEKVYRLTLVK